MKRMKSKKLNSALIAATLSASIMLGGVGAALINNNAPSIDALADTLQTNYEIQEYSGGHEWYVSPEGTNEGDGSQTAPYDLAYLLTNDNSPLSPGDTVLVLPGVYKYDTRIRIMKKGEYDKYITVKNADPSQEAVIEFYDMVFDSNNRGVQLDGDFWHWVGVDIRGAGDNGMYIGGSYNVIENCEFYDNRDTGLQLGRSQGDYTDIGEWPSYNLIKNCTSYNNYDNETYGENADGFAAKLTVGYGNIFDGCIAYRNSDDGWDLFAKTDSGNIGAVIIYNCVAFENGYLAETQASFNAKFPKYNHAFDEPNTNSYLTRDGDGNGFKLGGSVMEGDVFLYNCQTFNNRMHGVTDNSNPGVLSVKNVTAYNNSAAINDTVAGSTFGEIVLKGDGVRDDNKSGNINLARQTYSYNLMSNIVSVNNGLKTVGADEYRGSAEYSYFDMANGKANKVGACVDVSQRAEAYAQKGEKVDAINADIFQKVPSTWGDVENPEYVYNLSGKGNKTVHADFRNTDGSINMGEILKIKNYSTLFGDDNRIGADLTKTSWEDYTHYSYFNASNAEGEIDAAVKSAVATLDVNTNVNATFQDFDLIVGMRLVTISWQSSDESVISIEANNTLSPSGTHDSRAIVHRGATDKTVKLTATLTSTLLSSAKMTKEFNITVKADVPTIGDAVFEGVEDGRIIIDQYAKVSEPKMSVRNAADYNGKLLAEGTYDVKTVVNYGTDKLAYPAPIRKFTTSVAGVYNITKTVTLGDQFKNYSYNIYVASSSANVNFVGEPQIIVNRNGYTIGGEVSSATGKLYAYSSATQITDITSAYVIENGKGYEFRNDNIKYQFNNDNSTSYYIYYVLCNLDGDVTAEVQEVAVTTQNISTAAEFKGMLLDNNSSTIYFLTDDIDLSGENDWVGDVTSKGVSFKGVLNGLGHAISGLRVNATADKAANEQGSMIYKLEGGTIENIKFHDIKIAGKEKTGIIATTYGGYLYNIELRNVYVEGTVRVGGLVGQAMTGSLDVEQVSLVNEAVYEQAPTTGDNAVSTNFDKDIYYTKVGDDYVVATEYVEGTTYYTRKIDITGARSAGIIGFIQASTALDSTQTYISNCYVDAVIGKVTEQYVGSIVGSADDRNAKDYLEIRTCYSIATMYARTYMGGILGSHNKGTGRLRMSYCIFDGTLYYAQQKTEASEFAVKNCSAIVGRYIANGDAVVSRCYARFADHNSNFDVSSEPFGTDNGFDTNNVVYTAFWTNRLRFSTDAWTLFTDSENAQKVKAPYAELKFLGNWN